MMQRGPVTGEDSRSTTRLSLSRRVLCCGKTEQDVPHKHRAGRQKTDGTTRQEKATMRHLRTVERRMCDIDTTGRRERIRIVNIALRVVVTVWGPTANMFGVSAAWYGFIS